MIGACLGEIALTQLYRGQPLLALSLHQESRELNRESWLIDMLPFIHLHAGHYDTAEPLIRTAVVIKPPSFLPWVRLVQANYSEALVVACQAYGEVPMGNREHRAWAQIALAYALYGLDRVDEAQKELYQCLQTCVKFRAFLPLMQLMPIIPVVLADGADDKPKERAIELYALAKSLPFVGNSQLFSDLAGKPMAALMATLSPSLVEAAQVRGRELDWWSTAESLLIELAELGWAKGAGERGKGGAERKGRFVRGELVATGGFGEVYRGRDIETGRVVVIKRLKPELVVQQPEAVARFVREGELLRQLNHPNIVQMIASEVIEGKQCLIMEYVAGGSLRDLLAKEGRLSVPRALDIALELADALSRAHHLEIIHRDLKPAMCCWRPMAHRA
jgi:hypothetical protein